MKPLKTCPSWNHDAVQRPSVLSSQQRHRARTEIRILRALQSGELTMTQISRAAGRSVTTVARTLPDLLKARVIERRGTLYRLKKETPQ